MFEPYPIKFIPIYRQKIWGGEYFRDGLLRDVPFDRAGESWELSTLPSGASVISNGTYAGTKLTELIGQHSRPVVGWETGGNFPLLIKIIDAADDLSVQVHPDEDVADASLDEAAKTEAWYVLRAGQGTKIVYGLKDSVSREMLELKIAKGKIDECLRMVSVKAGDLIYVPAGTVHALVKGMAVVEIQQPSDTTFRLYDYERTDVGGRHRELQIDKALAAIKYDRQSPLKFDSTLLKCPAFTIEKICVDKYEVEHTNGRFAILTVVGGRGQISWQRGTVNVSMAETVLIPACMGPFSLQGSFEVLKTTAES